MTFSSAPNHNFRLNKLHYYLISVSILFLSNGLCQKSVTITAFDLAPFFSPGTSAAIVSLRFSNISGNAKLGSISMTRTGSATDSDVPTTGIYEDTNQDGTPDGTAFSTATFSNGSATFSNLNNKSLSTTIDWLIAFDIAPEANQSNNAGCSIASNGIVGSGGTVIIFGGFSSGDYTLPISLSLFTATVYSNEVNLKWRTDSEINNIGFEILRSETPEDKYVLISSYQTNPTLLGQGNRNGSTEYFYIDQLDSDNFTYWYKLVDVDYNGRKTQHGPIRVSSDMALEDMSISNPFILYPAYPNPFNPSTTIRFELWASNQSQIAVDLSIFDPQGQLVKTLYRGYLTTGLHEMRWNGDSESGAFVSSGMYYGLLKVGKSAKTSKLLLLK